MVYREGGSDGEHGQALVLFALMLAVLVSFTVLVIDTGVFIVERRNVQNVVDAAALAGAQELPDDPVRAEQMARDYAQRNGHDPDELQISFVCTSTYVQSCNPAANTYDTIVVKASKQAPALFGPILKVFGSDSCWTEGCSARMDASACRGICGGARTGRDVILAIDHTGSMSATDLQNAKDGSMAFLRTFDYQVHKIGLAVTPPVDPNDHCDTINSWSDPAVWLPVPLSFNYQSLPNVPNMNSPLVSTINCLDRPESNVELPGPHTNLGDPLVAALAELRGPNGRAGVPDAVVLFTDGAANIMASATATAMGARGPCEYAYMVAQQLKDAGVEVFTIAYGADDRCSRDASNSPWYNKSANEIIAAMATDADHSFIEPRSADLEPVFLDIAVQLAGGSKLVE